jgi:fibronectin-binding autotransporter adhesin
MNRKLGALASVLALAIQTPAKAAVITVLASGVLSNGAPVATFDGLTQTPYGSTTTAGAFIDGGASFSGSGIVMRNGPVGDQPSLGLYAEPFHDTTNYLALLGGASETISYATMKDIFGLYWGSLDPYNNISFFNGNALVVSYTGAQIDPLIANGDQQSDNSNRFVIFSGLNFDRVVLNSGQNSFEFDNVVAAAAPELASWVLMLVGFATIGFAARRRSRRSSVAVAAA